MDYYTRKQIMYEQVEKLSKLNRYSEMELCYYVERETGIGERTIKQHIEKLKILGHIGIIDSRICYIPANKRSNEVLEDEAV